MPSIHDYTGDRNNFAHLELRTVSKYAIGNSILTRGKFKLLHDRSKIDIAHQSSPHNNLLVAEVCMSYFTRKAQS
jgi:hypothetical protein